MAVDGSIPDVRNMFDRTTALFVQLRYMPNASDPLCGIDVVERFEIWNGGMTLYAKQGVSEEMLFGRVITTLASGGIVPEGISFRRLSLEQIYIGINNDTLRPVTLLQQMWGNYNSG